MGFVTRELAPARLRSSRESYDTVYLKDYRAATRPSGSKLPRHREFASLLYNTKCGSHSDSAGM